MRYAPTKPAKTPNSHDEHEVDGHDEHEGHGRPFFVPFRRDLVIFVSFVADISECFVVAKSTY